MRHSPTPYFRTVVIDVGKNFQAAAVEWFPKYGLRRIDAVLITHAHADGTWPLPERLVVLFFCLQMRGEPLAMNGLDDLRGTWSSSP
jgi:ribonuclease BN (tRNA processing enzyme)